MSALRLAVTVVSVAATIAQHPAVRAGVRAAAPHVLNPRNKEVAVKATLSAAYNAGVLTRRIKDAVTGK
ncbi:hypothetical protein JP74_11765 [Devosia sp. 17-2-E-8]|jgi:hypothetical protein|uniref:hypothetical protein n=1 Tax=Paradevosia shaoguanensis TaxID=1335043 RepID=UPI000455BCC5|nr:hypothetical protein [Paradevosia shaoguanensis]KFL26759.1 hypothetical protein JP74_11765 [Devosia sp. 17-2-E-8]CDP50221.1 hypothetical protein [Devosia sp. DBB001]